MARKPSNARGRATKARTETYKGHEIVYSDDERRKQIFIDGRPVRFGMVGDEYYLDAYAYDRGKTLGDVVKRYLDYRDSARKRSRKE